MTMPFAWHTWGTDMGLFIEQVITGSKFGRERLKFNLKRIEMMREKRAAAKAS